MNEVCRIAKNVFGKCLECMFHFLSPLKEICLGVHPTVRVCFPFKFLNRSTNFYETWYEDYAIGGHPNL